MTEVGLQPLTGIDTLDEGVQKAAPWGLSVSLALCGRQSRAQKALND